MTPQICNSVPFGIPNYPWLIQGICLLYFYDNSGWISMPCKLHPAQFCVMQIRAELQAQRFMSIRTHPQPSPLSKNCFAFSAYQASPYHFWVSSIALVLYTRLQEFRGNFGRLELNFSCSWKTWNRLGKP